MYLKSPRRRRGKFSLYDFTLKKNNDNCSSGGRGGCVPTISSWVEPPVERETHRTSFLEQESKQYFSVPKIASPEARNLFNSGLH